MYSELRKSMVQNQIKARGIKETRVLNAFYKVPRHQFIRKSLQDRAYADHPVDIGSGQTISQPYIVALMTDAAGIQSSDKILEIGTGCGYQTAILAELAEEVHTVERHETLSKEAEKTLECLGYKNINFHIGNGFEGLPGEAPFDAIIVTAAPPNVPPALLNQLAENGRLIIPVGQVHQKLLKIEKINNEFQRTHLAHVRFVPMVDSR